MIQLVLIFIVCDMFEDCISGFDIGVDDYLVKFFVLEEFNVCICVLFCWYNNQGDNEISVGNLCFNVICCLVWLGEMVLDFMLKEYVLLLWLMMKVGSLVYCEIFYNDIYSWDNELVINILEVYIYNLCEKIGKLWICIVWGFGYMLVNNIDMEQIMVLFVIEIWIMCYWLLLIIGVILVVCQLISVFWLWYESKEQIQLLVVSVIEGYNNQKYVEYEVWEVVVSLLVLSLLIVGLVLYISMLVVCKIICLFL